MRPLIMIFAIAASMSTQSRAQVLGPETPLAPAASGPAPSLQWTPRLAATAGGFFAAWTDSRGGGAVYGARLDRHGNVLDPFSIRLGTTAGSVALSEPPPVTPLAVATAGADAVVVIDRCESTDLVRVGADGIPTTPRSIAGRGAACFNRIEMATNGATFLVVWPQRAEIVDGDGRIVAGEFSTSMTSQFTVASDGKDYLLAGMQAGSPDVVVRPVTGDGHIGEPRKVSFATQPGGVALASDGREYLLITTGTGTQATIVNADGTVGRTTSLAGGTSATPRAAWNGYEYVVTFGQKGTDSQTARVVRLGRDGHLLGGGTIDEFINSIVQVVDVDVVGTGEGALVAWSHVESFQPPRLAMATVLSDASIDSGMIPAPIALSRSAADEKGVRLLRAGAEVVAAWLETTAAGSRLVAALLDGNGRPRSAPVDLGVPNPYSYRVAFDGTNILVAWYSVEPWTISMRRFTSSLAPRDGAPIVVATSASVDSTTASPDFDLAAGNGVALAAWSTISGESQIDGALVYTSNATPEPQPLAIGRLPLRSLGTHVAWNGSEFLVSWVHFLPYSALGSHVNELRGARVTAEGRLLDSAALTIASPDATILEAASASNGRDFYVSWSDSAGSMAGSRVSRDGTTPGGTGEPISAPVVVAGVPVTHRGLMVAALDADYIVAWNDLLLDRMELRVAGKPQSAFSIRTPEPPPIYFPVDPVPGGSGLILVAAFGAPSIAVSDGGLIVAYDRLANEAQYGGVSRVFARTVDPFAVRPRRRSF